jgi:hypothetical protein
MPSPLSASKPSPLAPELAYALPDPATPLAHHLTQQTHSLLKSGPGHDLIHPNLNRDTVALMQKRPRLAPEREGSPLDTWKNCHNTVHTEITAAHGQFAAAIVTGAWGCPTLSSASRGRRSSWSPPPWRSVVGRAPRAAITTLSELAEAAIDLHGRTLANALSVATANTIGPLTCR